MDSSRGGGDGYLAGLSELAGRGFASTGEAMAAILRLLVEQLGMRSSFISRVNRAEGRWEVLGAYNLSGGCGIPQGVVLPLSDSF